MKKLVLFLLASFSFVGYSQADPVYTHHVYNQFVVNPAYAGSRDAMSAVLVHRSRWTGIEGTPTTQSLSLHSKLNNSSLAWGMNIGRDRLGATSNTMAAFTGGYHLPMKNGKLSFGLRAGVYSASINVGELDLKNTLDPLAASSNQVARRGSADLGLYYYTRKFFIGLSFNHMNAGRLNYTGFSDANFYLRRYSTLSAGYAFKLMDNLILKPTFLLKAYPGFDANLDLNLGALFYERIWLSVGVRNQTALNFLLDVNITDYFRMGYSYDAFVNALSAGSNGAHEIFIGFDFNSNKSTKISPRYF